MQDAIKTILGILEEGTPELQIAAAQILGELRPSDAAIVERLASRLDHAESYLSRHLLTLLSQIQTKASISELVRRISDPQVDADLIVHLLRTAGDEVAPLLGEAYDDADPETRNRILDVLISQATAESAEVLEKALYDPELSKVAADALADGGMFESIPAKKRRYFRDRLKKRISTPPEGACIDVQAQCIRVLARADGTAQRALLVKLTEPENSPILREAALRGLRDGEVALTPTQAAAMLDFLSEADRERIVDPSIELLQDQPKWTDAAATHLRKLLASRRDHLRLFAILAFRHAPSAAVVKTLMNHLLGDVAETRDAASEALANNHSAVDPLYRAFCTEKDPGRAARIAGPLARIGSELTQAQCKSLLEKGCKLLIAHDPKGEAMLELLFTVRPEQAPTQLVDKALRLRRAKKVEDALQLLLFVAKEEKLELEGRYQLALTRLLATARPMPGEEHVVGGDPTMGYFAVLVRENFPVFDRLRRESTVDPDALLRVGRHFAAGVAVERRFGAELLEFVAQKHGKQRAGEEARMVLRAGGV